LKVILVNLLAALNRANVFFLKKNKKRLKNEKNVKNVKKRFLHLSRANVRKPARIGLRVDIRQLVSPAFSRRRFHF